MLRQFFAVLSAYGDCLRIRNLRHLLIPELLECEFPAHGCRDTATLFDLDHVRRLFVPGDIYTNGTRSQFLRRRREAMA